MKYLRNKNQPDPLSFLICSNKYPLCLQVFLHHIATFLLYSFSLTFLYLYVCFACWALINLTLYGPYIVIYLRNKNQPDALYLFIYWNKLRKKVHLVGSYYENGLESFNNIVRIQTYAFEASLSRTSEYKIPQSVA